MAKRKQKNIICDTSQPPIDIDVNAKDEDPENVTIEARLHPNPPDSQVFYMRMSGTLLNHVKQVARERSYHEQQDITYQMLICEAVAEKYPVD